MWKVEREAQVKQLIYKQERETPFDVGSLKDLDFFFATRPMGLRAVWSSVVGQFGLLGAVKSALKLVAGRRCLYGVVVDGGLIHFGWVSMGFCRFYEVEKGSCVIGPIWSGSASRGKGIATWALKLATNRLIELGSRTFYIDTSADNLPCRKVIQNCAFGMPTGTYRRGSDEEPGTSGECGVRC